MVIGLPNEDEVLDDLWMHRNRRWHKFHAVLYQMVAPESAEG